MTAFFLLKELCNFLRGVVDEYAAAQRNNKDYVKPTVFDWYLPFKNGRQAEDVDFPYIVPRIRSGENNDESTVTIMISFGVYCESPEVNGLIHPTGSYDLLNLMEHVRQALQKKVNLANKFVLKDPYTWEIPDEQPYPLWVGQATTIWNVGAIIPEDGGFLHG